MMGWGKGLFSCKAGLIIMLFVRDLRLGEPELNTEGSLKGPELEYC